MERKNQLTTVPKDSRNSKPLTKERKDENDIVAEAEHVTDIDKESFADRNHKRRHDSPADISNPGTV
ncbi:hypothetical protein [Parapedobacter koreensis]|uniref:Uncharacterized protein n=1 Tax=Parapedobacter koreensis TaxID=332977 RepID=A0A1H7MMU6_9SPHI|nr:hypothetical protein [Parapedobacter koreensis]SEL12640.1 hypothetical protein SAMN05421740_103582 [Parapedobacter koreensis]